MKVSKVHRAMSDGCRTLFLWFVMCDPGLYFVCDPLTDLAGIVAQENKWGKLTFCLPENRVHYRRIRDGVNFDSPILALMAEKVSAWQ